LSARATLPLMIDMETRHRSLVRGALAAKASNPASGAPQPLFTALRDGMQRMVESIIRHVPREALCSCRTIEGMNAQENGWQLRLAETTEDFEHVILAVPAHVSAKLIGDLPGSERPVELLNEIAHSSAVTVALAFDASAIGLPPGFGFLVPRREAKRIVACTFVHNKFENRAPAGTALLRVFMGGSRDLEILDQTDEQITKIVRTELREILNIDATPQLVRVFKWHKAMPQYGVGHLLRIARLEMHMQRFPGLHLIGNAYHGIGIPDCVRAGRAAADAIMRRMRSQRALA
jgi:protoporphyrinogen/coproporphyrinogen III oxidase